MIDIGANLTDKSFTDDLDEVCERAKDVGVERIVVTGTNEVSSRQAFELAVRYPAYLAATAGVHPHHADDFTAHSLTTITDFAKQGAVAIGETGLDYFRNFSTRANQRRVFQTQLELASALQLPVFVHDRDSEGEVLEMLLRHATTEVVVHCFTGDQALLDAYIAQDCYIGITGWVCDERRGKELASIVPRIPESKLLIETDSPYLMPRTIRPRPKTRRNEPMNLKYVRQKVAEVRAQSESHVDEITTANAKRFFRLN